MIKNITTKISTSLVLMLATVSSAMANDTVGSQLGSLSGEARIFGDFFMLIIGIAGVILLFMGIWGLKKYAEDSRQNELSKPLILTIAGALMSGFSFFQALVSGSMVGGTSEETGSTSFTAPND